MTVRSPPPMDDRDAGLEASVRMKLGRGERLDGEERAFLTRLQGDKDVPPGDVQ